MEANARALTFSPAALLALKVTAFYVMVIGHADWMLFDARFYVHQTLGRIVFPVFGFILAYHVARMDRARLGPLVIRLALGAAIATPFYAYLQGAPLPLNILATYTLALSCWILWHARMAPVAVFAFVFAGYVVDYAWFGVAGVLCCLWWLRTERGFLFPLTLFAALLIPVNGNFWSLAAVPFVWCAWHYLDAPAPRWKWVFYIGYPLHLVLLAALKASGV